MGATAASATEDGDSGAPSDYAILNFALNLEYLEAEFYSYAVNGHGISSSLTHGRGHRGPVINGSAVPFKSNKLAQFAAEIAQDELDHVAFLRGALGRDAVARPEIDLKNSFTAAAQAAGLIGPGQTFSPFDNENDFLLGAFIFEDVGVTAYKGAAPLINNKTYLSAAAGILAVEAYHASEIRVEIYERGLASAANAISAARNALDGNVDQGVTRNGKANIVPADCNSIAFGRTAAEVLNIVYLNPHPVNSGGFFPRGVNGPIHTSDN